MIKRFVTALKEEKKYIILASTLFALSCIYGALFFESVNEALTKAGFFDKLADVTKQIEQTPTFATSFSMIFFNNLSASFFAVTSGFLIGLVPVMMLISNGLLMGVVLAESVVQTQMNPLLLLVTTILPHGIFELPAIFIGTALGIHLGMATLRSIVALFRPQKREQSMLEWQGIGKRALVIVGGMVLLLLLAAVIESGLILLFFTI